jgi:AraC-like DNA-binding protein
MDIICEYLDALAQWVGRTGAPPLPYVGQGGGRFYNPPAPHVEICFVLKGGIERVRIGDKSFDIPPHHVSVHNVHFGNYSDPHPGTSSFCAFLDISGEPSLARMGNEAWCQVLPVMSPERMEPLFRTLAERCLLAGSRKPEYLSHVYAYHPEQDRNAVRSAEVLVQAALLELLGAIMEEAEHAGLGGNPGENIVVRRAEACMAKRYADPALSLADLAEAAHLSVDHFGRVFRTLTGVSPMQRLRVLRMEQARRLLGRGGMRVGEVARSVGFEDPYHFSRVFRQVMGVCPRMVYVRHQVPASIS